MATVLVVDADHSFLMSTRDGLTRERHLVFTADSATKGLNKLKTHRVEVLVLDVGGVGQGLEVLRQLTLRPNRPLVVAVSEVAASRPGEDDPLQAAARLGAALTLRKPVASGELESAIRRLTREGDVGKF